MPLKKTKEDEGIQIAAPPPCLQRRQRRMRASLGPRVMPKKAFWWQSFIVLLLLAWCQPKSELYNPYENNFGRTTLEPTTGTVASKRALSNTKAKPMRVQWCWHTILSVTWPWPMATEATRIGSIQNMRNCSRKDIKDGLHKLMEPPNLCKGKEEYEDNFSLNVFCIHIH